MNIGIFLGHGPQTVMKKEGLGRYLGDLLQGFLAQGHEVTVACPHWLRDSFEELLDDYGIDDTKISVLMTQEDPVLWKLYNAIYGERKSRFLSRVFRHLHGWMMKWSSRQWKRLAGILFISMFQQMNEYERKRLVDLVNRKGACDVWFAPGLFWPEVCDITQATVVCNAPDLTTEIFAEPFAGMINVAYATGMCRKTLADGTYFITYCSYVKKTLMEREYMKAPWQTKSIPHSNHDLLPYIHIDEALAKQNHTTKDYTDFFSWNLLQTGRVRYLFYASQPRHNKNIITMLRAYEYLIRKRFVRVRLFLTANVYNNAEVSKFIEDHALSHHVMTFPNVSNQKLAALYHCATLVVNPTLYEGGFPFTFGEGMSVGTPSVMSDIPQVREVLEPAGLEDIMFDPYDWRAMADKIEYALQHVDELYERELPLYQKLAERTPDVMAQDYVKAFEEFMEIDRQRKAAQTAEGACASS